jgi:hypothetical protein
MYRRGAKARGISVDPQSRFLPLLELDLPVILFPVDEKPELHQSSARDESRFMAGLFLSELRVRLHR